MSLEEIEALYEAERQKAPLIHPRLVFRQMDRYSFEMGFGAKHRHWTGIEQYKGIVRIAVNRRYPDCQVS
jgi:hypothetical protein